MTGAVASPHAVETPMSCANPCETGYPSSARTTRGVTTKMDATAANESWKPASKSAYGIPAEEHGRADEQRLPAVTLTAGQPGEGAKTGGKSRAHDRRVEPDGECVRGDREQGSALSEVDPEAQQQDHRRSTSPDGRDLQPVDCETVVQAGGAEVGEQALVDLGRTAEHDRLDDVAPLAFQAGCNVACEPAPDPVADPGDAATPADDAPRLRTKNRVDALPPQPRRLVEAVRRSRWSP